MRDQSTTSIPRSAGQTARVVSVERRRGFRRESYVGVLEKLRHVARDLNRNCAAPIFQSRIRSDPHVTDDCSAEQPRV